MSQISSMNLILGLPRKSESDKVGTMQPPERF
jgi:hypothetical protein